MTKKISILLFLSLLLLPLPAQSEGIPLQKDVFLDYPIATTDDLPEEITFTLYDSQTATTPLGSQTFQRGQYTVDFEFSKSNGITAGNVARVSADFTKALNLEDAEGEAIQPKELWAGIEVGGAEIGDRKKVSDETLVQLLLASDASIATYLTLAYEGDDNPITTIYKDLPIASLSSDGSASSLSNYFRAVTSGISEELIEPNSLTSPYWDKNVTSIYYNNGNVGIGTSTPQASLEIANPIGGSAVKMSRLGDVWGWLLTGSGEITIYDYINSKFLMAWKEGGNVGIGTLNPGSKLEIAELNGGTGTDARIKLNADDDTGIQYFVNNGYKWYNYYDRGGQFFAFKNDASTAVMLIQQNGNVGIGTLSPGSYKLAVKGSIRATEIVVDTGWADFVFEDNYRLPPLGEVERYINENKHLPGIPAKAEVEEKGVSVGNISSKLLQKIEELTLYVIDLKKANDSLKAQVDNMQEQLGSSSN